MVYTHLTPNGSIRFRASSWAFDGEAGTVELVKLRASEGDDGLLASASRVHLDGLTVEERVSGRRIRAYAKDFYARIDRDTEGDFRLLRYIEEPEGPPSEIPYTIDVDGVHVLFVDLAGKDRFVRRITAPRLTVDGVGDRWVASANATISDLGSTSLTVRANPEGLTFQGYSESLAAWPVLVHLATTPEGRDAEWMRNMRADSFALANTVYRIVVPAEGDLDVFASGTATGRNLVVEGYHFDQAVFRGDFSERGASGNLDLWEKGTTANAIGAIEWTDGLKGAFSLTAASPNLKSLPTALAGLIPNQVEAASGLAYRGVVNLKGDRVLTNGSADISRLVAAGEAFSGISGMIDSQPESVAVKIHRAIWKGETVSGALKADLQTKRLDGGLTGQGIAIGPLAQRYGVEGIDGSANATLIVEGTTDKPRLAATASGSLAYGELEGAFRTSGRWKDGVVQIDRFYVDSVQGALIAEGSWNSESGALAMDFFGTGVPAELFSEELKGEALFAGKITGTSQAPVATGSLELFDGEIAGNRIPILQAAFRVDRNRVYAENLVAIRGASRIQGDLSYAFDTGGLEGLLTAQDVQLADLFGEDLAGSVTVPRARVAGTLSNPTIEAQLEGRQIVAYGVRLDQAAASTVLERNIARLDSVRLTIGEGSLQGSGSFNLNSKDGVFDGTITDFPLERFARFIPSEVNLEGILSGRLTAEVSRGTLSSVDAQGDLASVLLNKVPFGGGPVAIRGDGSTFSGSGSLGELNRFIEVQDVKYNTSDNTLSGTINALGLRLHDLVRVARRHVSSEGDGIETRVELPAEAIAQLDSTRGEISGSVDLTGKANDPNILLRSLQMEDLSISGNDAGSIQAAGSRIAGTWTIEQFRWQDGPGDVSLTGTVAERGDMAVDGEVRNLNVDWLAKFVPDLGRFQGQSDISFRATGPTREPILEASYAYKSLIDKETGVPQRRVDALVLARQGRISLDGTYFAEGFTGTFEGALPFRFPAEFPQDEPIGGTVRLAKRSLSSLAEYLPGIAENSEGEIEGRIDVSGTLRRPVLEGAASLEAARVGFSGMESSLRDVLARIDFNGDTALVTAQATSSAGGTARTEDIKIELGSADRLLTRGFDSILGANVGGSLVLDRFQWRERNPQRAPTGYELDTRVTGTVALSGPLRTVLISTPQPIQIGTTRFVLPSEFPETGESAPSQFDPRFDVRALLSERAKLELPTGTFELTGSAALTGSLQTPVLNSELFVEKGQLRLPNARITLDDGGRIQAYYQATPGGDTLVRVEVDLQGRTGLTARGLGGNIERYDILLDIRGDLLKEGGLVLNAQSSPPGLSQEQILNLLGQGEILAGRQSGGAIRFDRQIQNALTQIALPALVDSYTSQWASSLGLDYLGFEYNPFEYLSLTLAKNLGKGFLVQYRRQLSETNGLPPRYELKLIYRPPFRRDLLGRFSFSVGLDQDRPWKISVEYGFRF